MQKTTTQATAPANKTSGLTMILGSVSAFRARALDLIFVSNAETSAAPGIWRSGHIRFERDRSGAEYRDNDCQENSLPGRSLSPRSWRNRRRCGPHRARALSSRSRFSRSAGSSALTVTLSKKASTGARKCESARMAPAKSSDLMACDHFASTAVYSRSANAFSSGSTSSPARKDSDSSWPRLRRPSSPQHAECWRRGDSQRANFCHRRCREITERFDAADNEKQVIAAPALGLQTRHR